MKTFQYIGLLMLILMLNSCVTHESLLNFNEPPRIPTEAQAITNFKPILIQASDILQIRVSSSNAAAVQPFSVSISAGGGEQGSAYEEYLVNSQGEINFPTLGEIAVKGLSVEDCKDKIEKLLAGYFEEPPLLQMRLSNFKVNVNGEVSSPGSYSVNNERLTILEAVTLAGDLTSYAQRDSILVIREMDGQRNFGYVNFNSAELFDSPYFYLQQNDMIYVPPSKLKTGSLRDPATRVLPWVTSVISVVAILISITR